MSQRTRVRREGAMGLAERMIASMSWLVPLVFVAAVGACVGSLVNVLVYRLPRGLSVVSPPSRCPSCQTRLTWRENVPVLGWAMLGGRCRFCRARIGVEYPLVELVTSALFAMCWAVWFVLPRRAAWLGVEWAALRPEWAMNGPAAAWPIAAAVLITLACFIALTLIDARTFSIPLELVWVPTAAAAIAHTGLAAWLEFRHGPVAGWLEGAERWVLADGTSWRSADGWVWSIPTAWPLGWATTLGAIAAVLGLAVGLGLVRLGLIGRSFAGYNAWERAEIERAQAAGEPSPEPQQLWIRYPHARREMVLELAFLAPAALLAAGVGAVGGRLEGLGPMPLWLGVLGGVALGYLVGGGVVWFFRIFGTLAFRKEAMGMGDVHLMAAAGACFGWVDAFLGFFAAGFIAAAHALAGAIFRGRLRRQMPFGPYLVLGVLLVDWLQPLVESGLGALMGLEGPLDLP